MRIPLTLPQLGLTQTEGSVSEWLKKPGDPVKKNEVVFVISTDKVEMEIESPEDGVMGEILIEPGVVVDVGTQLAWLVTEGEQEATPEAPTTVSSPAPAVEEQPVTANVAAVQAPSNEVAHRDGRRIASPRARRVAKQLGVDLDRVRGTGPEGRIVEDDVRAAAASASPKAEAQAGTPVSRHRQIIARRMIESIQTIPAFSVTLEVNATKLVDLYESIGPSFLQTTGTKLSYTDLLLKSVALALEESPALNTSWSAETTIPRSSVDINLAVGTDGGVTAPLLRGVGAAPLREIASARASLAKKARERKLSLAELENGTGTLSNLGMYRVDSFTGIITPGQSFIVSAGRMASRPWVDGNALTIQPTMALTVSVDHRLVDGVEAAEFLGRIAERIEKPFELVWDRA
jgi:pyruvate dehydrogenase E2 component (dihydrolipoamide acetyltransferase)